tara:strand:- start:154 stop:357 length:204 start_codon:yes stop_codon:yes gene_type:complete
VRRCRSGFGAPVLVKTLGEVLTSTGAMLMLRPEKGLKMGNTVNIFGYFVMGCVAAAVSILVTTGKLR